MKITAIILAAGKGLRVGGDISKQYMEVNGRPVLAYALESFEKSNADEIVIVTDSASSQLVNDIAQKHGITKFRGVVTGGRERCFSVLNALRALSSLSGDDERPDLVLIHDGARPYITADGINRLAEAALEFGAAVAASPSKDTIKITDSDGFVQTTTDRFVTWCAQTPQCFEYSSILEAYERVVAPLENSTGAITVTDDSMVYQEAFPGRKIKLMDTGSENGKITTPEDLEYMKYYFKR